MKRLALAALAALVLAPGAQAESIERACNRSGRDEANRRLCGCIQDVANLMLTRRDQRQAAAFFGDPHRAQEIRQSGRRKDETFWQRYKEFGAMAEVYCDF